MRIVLGGLLTGLLAIWLLTACGMRPAGLLRPNGVAVAPDGSLYVMDRGNYRVIHLSATGQLLDTFGQLGGGPADIYAGWDIDLDSAGNIYICHHVWSVDGAYRAGDGVKVFTPEGQFLRELGGHTYTYGDELWYVPYGLDIDEQGQVYVADFDANTVRVFDPQGEELATLFGEQGNGAGQLYGPVDVAVDDQRGLLYVSDQFNSQIQQFRLTTTDLGELTVEHQLSFGSYGREPGQLAYPQNIVVDDPSGRIYVSDMANRRIQVFEATGEYLSELAAPGQWQVFGLDVDRDGTVYAADTLNNVIWIFEPDGQIRRRVEVRL